MPTRWPRGAHRVWKHVVRKGDAVVDATCGNGYDTLAMLKLVADESCTGRVYGLDVQGEALVNTSSLLDESVNQAEVLLLLCILRCVGIVVDLLSSCIINVHVFSNFTGF